MKLESITLSGFRSYREPVTISFSDGLTAIAGANGSGKSSIFDALMWCLYGIGRGRADEMVHAGERNMRVEVSFEHGGGTFKAIRQVRWTDAGGTVPELRFYRAASEISAEDVTGSTIRETQDAIAEVIGPSAVAFSTWYLAQGQASAFFDAAPAERRQVLGDALGISGEWDELREKAIVQVREVGAEFVELRDDVTRAQGVLSAVEVLSEEKLQALKDGLEQEQVALEKLEASKTVLKAGRMDIESKITALTTEVEALTEQVRVHNTWQSQVRVTDDELARMKVEYEKFAENQPGITDAEVQLAKYETDSEQHSARVRAWQARRQALEENVRGAQHYLSVATSYRSQEDLLAELSGGATCPTCGQDWKGADKGRLKDQQDKIKTVMLNLDQSMPGRHMDPDEARKELRTAEAALKSLPELPEPPVRPQVDYWINLKAKGRAIEQSIETLSRRAKDLTLNAPAPLEASPEEKVLELNKLRAERDSLSEQISKADVDLTKAAAELRGLRESIRQEEYSRDRKETAKREVTETQAKVDELAVRKGHLEMLLAGLAPAGARQLILDTMIPRIEHEANALLDRIAPGTLIEFSTQRETGTETLDIRVVDPVGYRRVETMSGGERTRVMFALRVAMSNVAAASHGLAALPAFIIDETFGDQDPQGRAALLDALQVLAYDVEQVVAVTHDVELLGNIDQVIRLEKINGATVVAGE